MNEINILIPVHNEGEVLKELVEEFISKLNSEFDSLKFRLIIIQNGSTDNTQEVLEQLSSQYDEIQALTSPVGDYGKALKFGLKHVTTDNLFFMELDVLDIGYVKNCINNAENFDLSVQSKRHKDSIDQRPFERRAITLIFNLMLMVLGFRGTDTHGNKCFKYFKCKEIIDNTILDGNLFATEFVLQCYKKNLRVIEFPIVIDEIRDTSVGIYKRIIPGLKDYLKLFKVMK